jgi:hypothetical protein
LDEETPDLSQGLPPVIDNMSRNKTTSLKAVVESAEKDLCSLGMIDASAKYATPNSRLIKSNLENFVFATIGSEAKAFMDRLQKGATCFGQSHGFGGMYSYSESVKGSTATAMWRDDSGGFHGCVLLKVDGEWKIDFSNFG